MNSAQISQKTVTDEDSHTSCEVSFDKYSSVSADGHLDAWKNCRNELKSTIPAPFFETFIRDLTPELSNCAKKNLTLYAEESMLPHLKDKYGDLIKNSLENFGFKGQLSILSRRLHAPNGNELTATNHTGSTTSKLNTESFIPNPENYRNIESLKQLDFHAASVFIHGRPGTGKTHLAELLHSLYTEKNDSSKYMSLESFILELGSSIKNKNTDQWKTDLRNLDALFIDDFQFIKKTAVHSQEELRKIFDFFSAQNKKIFFISDVPLANLPLREDFLSRLQTGLNLTLLPPDQKGRSEILKQECMKFNLSLSENEINLISARIRDDIRKLKSVPHRLLHRNSASDIMTHIEDLFTPGLPVLPEQILKTVAEHFQILPEAITGPSRNRIFTLPRQITAYLCTELLQMKLTDIASLINRKDHSCVVHFRKSLEKTMENDLFLSQEIRQIRVKIERNIY